jgi:hypothetical protein
LSFVIMALAVMVIAIVTMKFNTELKAMKQQRGGVHEADVGRLSAAGAAFALGIANMRRRRLRTGLTAVTLTLLTFTVLSFTSVKTGIRSNKIRLSQAPEYQGVLLRDRAWLPLEQPTADIIGNEFAGAATVSPRAWYTSADVSKELTVDVALASDPAKRGTASCLLGLTAQERGVLPVDKLLAAGKWLPEGARNVALLPTSLAKALGVTEAMLGTATVTLFGGEFRVVGLVDENRLRGLKDLDGEALTPVNYAMLRPELLKELQVQAQQRAQLGTSTAGSLLQEYKHFSPERVVILPYDRVLELGGTLRSVAVRRAEGAAAGRDVEAMLSRFALSLYCGIGRETYLFSSAGTTSFSGLEGLLVPVLIAALIVLNTMLGSVYERTREIGIYSSLGLAPSHIGMLFLAEAAVFANLGAIAGYLVGQTLARVLFITGHTGGLELNYSSTSAVGVTAVVALTVILSTLYPSRRASEIASPAVARRWALPEPQGDGMDILLPFTVTGTDALGVCGFLAEYFGEYVGYSGGEFLAEGVALGRSEAGGAGCVSVTLRMWLAPYDLGVAQDFALECRPTGDGDIHEVHIGLKRLAGDLASWKKANVVFLSNIRKQFLLWRTVPQSEKTRYASEVLAQG